eukprot:CAMPEP_0195032768 /NCGR_PEP_ID=MMETSP0326_2-20130528/64208_1 /TAXON_ID=2866 ORGANISM="Crypthecodinium cohnii, Strain Seligo" /NCGR_SAMPLE_ID=MMETSP0326_2 /ASSEMBLY_ACC=CAM_ASM_000348 /LENGTH=150 /DNA_ID=CAMNT_0040057003 /DNA_START=508 /DNA_END=957 /DNA_ORIENTATION=+
MPPPGKSQTLVFGVIHIFAEPASFVSGACFFANALSPSTSLTAAAFAAAGIRFLLNFGFDVDLPRAATAGRVVPADAGGLGIALPWAGFCFEGTRPSGSGRKEGGSPSADPEQGPVHSKGWRQSQEGRAPALIGLTGCWRGWSCALVDAA